MDDSAIIDLYFARSEKAIQETGVKYGNYLHTIAENILHTQEDSEEAVNDTYLAAWNAMPPTRPRVLRHFLSRIVRNLSFKRYSYLTADKRSTGTQLLLSELEECLPDGRQDLGVQMEKRCQRPDRLHYRTQGGHVRCRPKEPFTNTRTMWIPM